MANTGEILVGDYLRIMKDCDFIDYNVTNLKPTV